MGIFKALGRNLGALGAAIAFVTLVIIAIRAIAGPTVPRTNDSQRGTAPTYPVPKPLEGMMLIPTAEFVMGSSERETEDAFAWCQALATDCRRDIYQREYPAHRVRVSDFYLDRHERTNAELAAWLSSSPQLRIDSEGWAWIGALRVADLFSSSSPLRQDHKSVIVDPERPQTGALPVTYITNDGARAFCRARGLDLPTEAQWERAARGMEMRRFAWGNESPTCERAVFARTETGACASAGRGPVPADADTRDRTLEGVLNLGGNVAEWVLDRFAPYVACEPLCLDPVVLPTASSQEARVIRGGSADGPAHQVRGAGRSRSVANGANRSTGFRCATHAPENL